ARRNYRVFVRPSVLDQRLAEFQTDPQQNGPKVRNTWIDKRASTSRDMARLPWNQQLMSLMAQTAQVIAAGFEDGRFGNDPIDWLMLVYECMYRIFLSVIKSRPKPRGDGTLETAPQIKTRI
ncbi:MAG: hypothetical protein NXY57DRAFT_868604, partial [Lentinula lateritia]